MNRRFVLKISADSSLPVQEQEKGYQGGEFLLFENGGEGLGL